MANLSDPLPLSYFLLGVEGEDVVVQSVQGYGRDMNRMDVNQTTNDDVIELIKNVFAEDVKVRYVPNWVYKETDVDHMYHHDHSPPVNNFNFEIEFAAPETSIVTSARSVKGIGVKVGVKEITQSTSMTPVKVAGNRSFPKVTLSQVVKSRDVPSGGSFYEWIENTANWDYYRADVNTMDIYVRALARDMETTRMTWILRDCYPLGYNGKKLEAQSQKVMLRDLTVKPRTIEVSPGRHNAFTDFAHSIFDTPERKNLHLKVYKRSEIGPNGAGTPTNRFKLYDTWAKKLMVDQLNASEDGILTHELTLDVGGFEQA